MSKALPEQLGRPKRITLANLPESTAQEVFDHVTWHLLTQMKKSVDASSMCSYRGRHSRQCAAGSCIDDEEYRPEFEGKRWSDLVDAGYVPEHHARLIHALQVIHDSRLPSDWSHRLIVLAEEQDLTFNPPPEQAQ